MKKFVLILSIFVLTVSALGCTSNSTEYQNGSTPATTPVINETPAVADITILNDSLVKDDIGGYNVKGTAQANKDMSYAEIDVKFYDKSGAVLQSGLTNILDLKAGEKWNFEVLGPGSDKKVDSYKIAYTSNP
jgi:uncharacterized protein YcfL